MVEHAINWGVLHSRDLHPWVTQRCPWTPHQPSMIKPSNPPSHLINCIYASPKALHAHQDSPQGKHCTIREINPYKNKILWRNTQIYIYIYAQTHRGTYVLPHGVCTHPHGAQTPLEAYPDTHTPLYLHVGSNYLYIHKPYKCSTHPAQWQLRFSVIS